MTCDARFDYAFRGRAFKMKSKNQVPTESLTMETPSKGVKMSTYLEEVYQLSIFDSYLSSASDIIDQSVPLSLRSNGLGSLSVVLDLLTNYLSNRSQKLVLNGFREQNQNSTGKKQLMIK